MKRPSLYHIAVALLLAMAPAAHATDITVTEPGTLTSAIAASGAELSTLTTLTVSGPVNAADLYAIGNSATALTGLDLSKATISAYEGSRINGNCAYPANYLPTGVFAGSMLQNVVLPVGDLALGDMAFASSQLKQLPAMTNVTTLGDGVFSGCLSLTEIAYPVASASVGAHIFAGCTALTTVDMQNASTVAPYAFNGCTALTTVNGTDALTFIGTDAFNGCSALETFHFGPELRSIGSGAFAATALTVADLSECKALASIGDFAFAHNTVLDSVALNSEARPALGAGVFFDDAALTAFTLPSGTRAIPDYAFKGTAKLRHSLPDGLDSIGHYAMTANDATTELTLPHSLTYIGDGAMEGMTSLTKITAGTLGAAPELGNDVWAGVDQAHVTLIVNQDAEPLFRSAAQWQDFNITTVSGDGGIVADGIAGVPAPKARFDGTDLHVLSEGRDIARVALYDINGKLLAVAAPASELAVIDTAPFSNPVFVVYVTLADGTNASLKLKR